MVKFVWFPDSNLLLCLLNGFMRMFTQLVIITGNNTLKLILKRNTCHNDTELLLLNFFESEFE